MNAPAYPASMERPDVARANAHLASGAPRPDDPDPIGSMRAFVRRYGDIVPRAPLHGVEASSASAPGLAAEWIVAAGADTSRRLVYLHGGGWVAGDLESHRPIAAVLSELTRGAVLLVDYRLAPEHVFPAGLEDCRAALDWARHNGPKGASPATRIMLAGDSAGANLAAAVCLAATTAERPHRLALLCGALDGSVGTATTAVADMAPDAAGLAVMMQLYAQGQTPLDDPRISPLLAADAALAAFPPTLVQVSSSEFLFPQSQRMAERLTANGVRTVLSAWPGLPHVWHAFLDLLPEARSALAEAAQFLVSD